MSGHILIYQDKENNVHTEVQLEDESVWLNQNQLADLFKKTKQNISLHIRNIFKEGELSELEVVKESLTTASDGKKYLTKHYNLDVIISVGYRVKSKQGTRFRIWANKILKEYLIKGYSLDTKRLKEKHDVLEELQKTIILFEQAQLKVLSHSEASGLLSVLTNYTHSFILLNQFDTSNFPEGGGEYKYYCRNYIE